MPPVQKNTDFNKRGHHNRDYAQEWEMTGDDCVDRRASVTDVRYVTFVTWSCFIRRKCRLKKTMMLHLNSLKDAPVGYIYKDASFRKSF